MRRVVLCGVRFFLNGNSMQDFEDPLTLHSLGSEIRRVADMSKEILSLTGAADKSHRPRGEAAMGRLLESEDLNVVVARVILDSLERRLDVLTAALKHLCEDAGIENQRAGDAERRIVAPRGMEDIIHPAATWSGVPLMQFRL